MKWPPIKLLIPTLLIATSCLNQSPRSPLNASAFASAEVALAKIQVLPEISIALPNGKILKTRLALSNETRENGLSAIDESSLADHQGMLFLFSGEAPRQFWMPNTYFDLDVFFLDANLRVLKIARDLAKHPGLSNTPPISFTPTVFCAHVLELKASSKISKEITEGMHLQWMSRPSLSQIKSSIRL
jgi:uncharacterized membrane protein (UPF0127 family)